MSDIKCGRAEADADGFVDSVGLITGRNTYAVRLPEVPAPMPTSDRELWVNVYPEGFDGYLGASQPSRKMAIARGAPGSLGVVQLAPVPESWQPTERSKP